MQIDQRIIDEIIAKQDIVSLIGKVIKLKRSGINYFACCPFHSDKTPSFAINSKQQFFHCFGCGASGNVITFVMRYYGLDFIEAIKKLADDNGIILPSTSKNYSKEEIVQQKQTKNNLSQVLQTASVFYHDTLYKTPFAKEYLYKRGITDASIIKFQIGFATDNFQNLSTIFKDYASNIIYVDAGLIIKTENNKTYDRFRNRIMFPIKNVQGTVIGFGGRVINNSEPKYLNSPETTLFNKSIELFGLFYAQKSIYETKYVIIVEGYMDVITLMQHNINNVVATMGTAITNQQIIKLLRLADDVYYCFDGDLAGKKAAWRALEHSLEIIDDNKTIYFVFLPQKHDPDSFVKESGKEKFLQIVLKQSIPLSSYLISELSKNVNLGIWEGKAKFINLIKPFIEKIQAPALKVLLKQQIAQLINLPPSTLENILNNKTRYAFKEKDTFEYPKTNNLQILNNIQLITIQAIIYYACNNIQWIHDFRLPIQMQNYSPEIQDLIHILDYIQNNYSEAEIVTVEDFKNKVTLNQLDINQIVMNMKNDNFQHLSKINSQSEFNIMLETLLNLKPKKINKIPNIEIGKKS